VKTSGQVNININTASTCAMQALGLSDADISDIVQSRRLAPYNAVPGKYGARGFGHTTRTFRIEAEGIVGGRVAARLLAIVQKRDVAPPVVAILEWSTPRESR
jgi:hypothetical protein